MAALTRINAVDGVAGMQAKLRRWAYPDRCFGLDRFAVDPPVSAAKGSGAGAAPKRMTHDHRHHKRYHKM